MFEKYFLQEEDISFWRGDYFKATGALFITTVPNFLFNLAHIIMIFSDLHTMKDLNDSVKIGGYGIGLTIIHTFCYAIIIAITNGTFTLLSQSYGAKSYVLMGNIFQRAQMIMLCYFLIMFPFLYQTKYFLVSMGIPENTSQYTQDYVRWSLVAMFFRLFFETTRAYVQSQKVFYITMYASLGVYLTYPFWIWFYVYQLGFEVKGLGMCRSTCEIISYTILYLTIRKWYMVDFKETWFKYNIEAFRNWGSFLRVAIPVGMITFVEFSFWEVQTFIVGTLKLTDQLAAHTSYGTIEVFLFYLPLALSFTISSYLGNLVGENQIKKCQNFVKFVQFTNLMLYLMILVFMRILKGFFTNEFALVEYREYFSNIYDLGTIGFILGDCFQVTQSSILRTLGLHDFAMVMMIICYYCIGIPLSILLVYKANLKVYGVWVTLTSVACMLSLIVYIKTHFIDYKVQIDGVLKTIKPKNKLPVDQIDDPLIKNHDPFIKNPKQENYSYLGQNIF